MNKTLFDLLITSEFFRVLSAAGVQVRVIQIIKQSILFQ